MNKHIYLVPKTSAIKVESMYLMIDPSGTGAGDPLAPGPFSAPYTFRY